MVRKRKRDKRNRSGFADVEVQAMIEEEISKDIRNRSQKELNEEQRKIPQLLDNYDIVFANGIWGSGKSFACLHAAYHAFKRGEFKKIIITRPWIADKLGALPGGVGEKLIFEMQPILENLYTISGGKHNIDKMIKDGTLIIQYSGKVKGLTFVDSVVVIDEAQDFTYSQFQEVFTRLGKTSKVLVTLSAEQVHRSIGEDTCFKELSLLRSCPFVGWVDLVSNHRNPIINKTFDYISEMKRINEEL